MSITASVRFGARPLGRPFRLTASSSVDVTAEFVDAAGAPAAVTGVTFTARQPDGTTYTWTEGTLTEISTGVWRRLLTPPLLGSWLVTAACTGPWPESAGASLDVRAVGDTGASAAPQASTAGAGDIGFSGLTMATARLLGRTTAGAGAVQQIAVGNGLSLGGGTLAATEPLSNAAAANPAVTDDSTQGYGVGSRWTNTATGQVFNCLSAAVGAAVWSAMDAADNPGPILGVNYPVAGQMANAATLGAADTLYAMLLMPDFLANIVALGPRVSTTAGGTGSAFKTCVLPHDPATNRPGATAIAANNAGTASTTTGELMGSLAAAVQIVPGRGVWICGAFSASTPLPSVNGVALGNAVLSQQLGLGLGANQSSQPVGFTTPFAFSGNIGAANAFSGAVWTPAASNGFPHWMYRLG